MVSMSCGSAAGSVWCDYYTNKCYINGTGNAYVVVAAAGITAAMVLGLTAYAFYTKTDFTFWGGFLWMALFSFAFMGMFMGIFSYHSYVYYNGMYIFYCAIGVVIFGMYLIHDTQVIMGGKRGELGIDDYILGAMLLYIDIIRIFMYVLQILQRCR
jgi:FtsH-binding integral membrane protein